VITRETLVPARPDTPIAQGTSRGFAAILGSAIDGPHGLGRMQDIRWIV
jgi:hypothetical protein